MQGHLALLDACKRCFASLFTDRAISYRVDKGFDHFKIALSIGVQRMVRADLGASGVMFTIDTETGFRDAVLINAAYGLGENVVQGSVNPDEYYVFKPTLKNGCSTRFSRKSIGSKEFKLVYDIGGGKMVKNVPVPPGDRAKFAIGDDEISQLARWACLIEDHYSAKKGQPDADGHRVGEGRPHRRTVHCSGPARDGRSRAKTGMSWKHFGSKQRGPVLITGRSVGEKIATGPVRVIKSAQFIDQFQGGRSSRHRQNRSGLGADHEEGRRHRHQSRRAHLPCRHREPRAGRACDRRDGARHRSVAKTARPSPSHAPKATPVSSMKASCRSKCSGRISKDLPRPKHQSDDECGQSRGSFFALVYPKRWRRAGARGIHHQQLHQNPSAGAARLRQDRGRLRKQAEHRQAHARLRRQTAVLRG